MKVSLVVNIEKYLNFVMVDDVAVVATNKD